MDLILGEGRVLQDGQRLQSPRVTNEKKEKEKKKKKKKRKKE